MFCPKCGAQMPDTAIACENCGTLLKEEKKFSLTIPKVSIPKTPQDLLNRNLLGLACSLLLIIATLLPFYKIDMWGETETVRLIQGDGIFMLIFAIAAIVLYVLSLDLFAVIPGALSLLILIIDCVNANSELSDYGDFLSDWGVEMGYGIGLWVVIIACIGMIAAPFVWQYIAKSMNK